MLWHSNRSDHASFYIGINLPVIRFRVLDSFCTCFRGRPKALVLLSAENGNRNRNRKSIVSGPKPHSLNNKSSYVIKASLSGLTDHSTRCRRRQRSQLHRLSLHSQSVHNEANDFLRLVHSLLPQLKLSNLLSATTEFTYCSTPKPKVYRMWYDCFRPKPNVRRKCSFVHIRRRNRNRSRNSVGLYLFSSCP